MPKTVCVLYGFCEGPQVGRRFERALVRAGYAISRDPAQADILIGHSGGCFLVPAKNRAQKIIQIGIPYWPRRSLFSATLRKLASDARNHHRKGALRFWTHKTLWNAFYFWNMSANIRMLRGRTRGNLWRFGKLTTVVRPKHDTFCLPQLAELPFGDKPKTVELPGHHDDCWRLSDRYLKLL